MITFGTSWAIRNRYVARCAVAPGTMLAGGHGSANTCSIVALILFPLPVIPYAVYCRKHQTHGDWEAKRKSSAFMRFSDGYSNTLLPKQRDTCDRQ